jgi:hypothetical protein
MSHRHHIYPQRTGNLREEGVPYLSRRFLQREAMFLLISLHLTPLDGRRDTQFMRQRRDVLSISIGFSAAQQVVEVSNMKLYSQSFTEASQYVNQAYRVRPTGDTYYQEFISPDQIVFPDKP